MCSDNREKRFDRELRESRIRAAVRSLIFFGVIWGFVFSKTVMTSATPALSEKKISVMRGCAYVLYVDNNDEDDEVLWKSADPSKVKIVYSNNQYAVIKALQKGSTKITAKTAEKKMKCTVKVTKPASFPEKMMILFISHILSA